MNTLKQQIIISGVGGQGVLFVTRVMAEAAIAKGLPVFTSETHGMAQRGGTVVSHLKIGTFASPMIRPYQADGLISLKAENIAIHGSYVKPGGWVVVNSEHDVKTDLDVTICPIDADGLAQSSGQARSANLIVLGFALARIFRQTADAGHRFFCDVEDIKSVLEAQLSRKKMMLDASVRAIETGYNQGINKEGVCDGLYTV